VVEILRAKDDRFVGPFTIAQVTSILVIVAGIIVYAKLRPAPAAEPGEYLARTA
jgi:prolipoprotein diacylglyceryltransferase